MKSRFVIVPLVGGALILLASWGLKTPPVNSSDDSQPAELRQTKAGEQVFKRNCASCHQIDGSGVPHLAPPLIGTKYVLGDKARLIHIVLDGLNEDIEIENEHFTNPMPPFSKLSDKDIANVLTYVRSNFGNKATAVSPSEVRAERRVKD